MSRKQTPKDSGLASSFKRNTKRVVNRNGSFNVKRTGSKKRVLDVYQHVINIKWRWFFTYVVFFYFSINAFFACVYSALGRNALSGMSESNFAERIPDAFYFSVQTFTSVGYGGIVPLSGLANFVSSIEALIGLIGFAIITGTLYGRFSKPVAKMDFSDFALINTSKKYNEFQFKLVNRRNSQMMDLETTVLYSSLVTENGEIKRDYKKLDLRLSKILFFPLSWTVAHVIDDTSPLFEKSEKQIEKEMGEFLIHVKGLDEVYGTEVSRRLSYLYTELKWGYEFERNFETDDLGIINLDLDGLNRVRKVN